MNKEELSANITEAEENLKKAFAKIVEKIINIAVELVRKIANAIIPILPLVVERCARIIAGSLYLLADSRIVYLAKHGKNARIRKKNHKRALKQGFKKLNEGAENGSK